MAAGLRGGTLFADRYRLEHELTEDDTTTTWQAQDVALERSVRLQLLRPGSLRDTAAAEAFRRDVRQAARATSPTAKVLDGGDDTATGLPFVVFEWDPAPEMQLTQPIELPVSTTAKSPAAKTCAAKTCAAKTCAATTCAAAQLRRSTARRRAADGSAADRGRGADRQLADATRNIRIDRLQPAKADASFS